MRTNSITKQNIDKQHETENQNNISMYKVPRNTSSSTSSTAVKIPGLRVTYDHSEITVYPNPEIYVLHSSQGQFSGIHDLIEFLKLSRLLHVFRFSGNIRFQTIGPKLLKDRSPFLTE